jgi:hypothetical protein
MRVLSTVLVALLLPGCSSLKSVQRVDAEASLTGTQPPPRIRIVLADRSKIELAAPRIAADSLRGIRVQRSGQGFAVKTVRSPYAVALTDVQGFELRRFSAVKTTFLVLGIASLALLIVAAASFSSLDLGGGSVASSGGGGTGYSSCPLLDSWDGSEWWLDSGTFGGAVFRPIARTDVDELVHLRPVDGRLALRLHCDAAESDHVDALAIAAIDHPAGTTIAPDSDGNLHLLRPAGWIAPTRATDGAGRDVRPTIAAEHHRWWESRPFGRDPARDGDLRDTLELEFARPNASHARLVVDARTSFWAAALMSHYVSLHGAEAPAWYAAMNADTAQARAFEARVAAEASLRVALWTGERWEDRGAVRQPGPDVAKRQVHELDLTGTTGDRVRVRLESAPSFWLVDRIALDASDDGPAPRPVPLRRIVARDARGQDAARRLGAIDGEFLTLESGEDARVEFADARPPAEGTHEADPRHPDRAAACGRIRVHRPTSAAIAARASRAASSRATDVRAIASGSPAMRASAARSGSPDSRPCTRYQPDVRPT